MWRVPTGPYVCLDIQLEEESSNDLTTLNEIMRRKRGQKVILNRHIPLYGRGHVVAGKQLRRQIRRPDRAERNDPGCAEGLKRSHVSGPVL